MDGESQFIILFSAIFGSSVIATIIKNRQENSRAHRQLISEASKSAYSRVEMYYRIVRRDGTKADTVRIRDLFHKIQEENEYYKTLLSSESRWHGERYSLYIAAIIKITRDQNQRASMAKPRGPLTNLPKDEVLNHKKIEELGKQFAKDSRRLMNPFFRPLMWLRGSKLFIHYRRIKSYDI